MDLPSQERSSSHTTGTSCERGSKDSDSTSAQSNQLLQSNPASSRNQGPSPRNGAATLRRRLSDRCEPRGEGRGIQLTSVVLVLPSGFNLKFKGPFQSMGFASHESLLSCEERCEQQQALLHGRRSILTSVSWSASLAFILRLRESFSMRSCSTVCV